MSTAKREIERQLEEIEEETDWDDFNAAIDRIEKTMIEATTKDRVSITSNHDLTVICSGRAWMAYHDIGESVVDCVINCEEPREAANAIRRNADKIAAAYFKAKEIK